MSYKYGDFAPYATRILYIIRTASEPSCPGLSDIWAPNTLFLGPHHDFGRLPVKIQAPRTGSSRMACYTSQPAGELGYSHPSEQPFQRCSNFHQCCSNLRHPELLRNQKCPIHMVKQQHQLDFQSSDSYITVQDLPLGVRTLCHAAKVISQQLSTLLPIPETEHQVANDSGCFC